MPSTSHGIKARTYKLPQPYHAEIGVILPSKTVHNFTDHQPQVLAQEQSVLMLELVVPGPPKHEL